MQYCDPNVAILDANCIAASWSRNQRIWRTIGWSPNFVTHIGNHPLWSGNLTPTVAICVISPESIGLPSITSTCRMNFNSTSCIWWCRAKSWSMNAMPVAPQSISPCVDISWLFTVNVQVMTKCFLSIDPSNTSTLPTDKREIPKHLKAFKTNCYRQLKSHPWAIDLTFFEYLRPCPGSYFFYLSSSHFKRFSFLPGCTVHRPVVKSTTL